MTKKYIVIILAISVLFVTIYTFLFYKAGDDVDKNFSSIQKKDNEANFPKLPHSTTTSVVIKDPVNHDVKNADFPIGGISLKAIVDINNDGYQDYLLSDFNNTNGYMGNFWDVYINNKDGTYHVFDNSSSTSFIVFRADAVGYDTIPGEKNKSIITYTHSSANDGFLVWYRIEDDKIIINTKHIEPLGKDAELYKKYIQNPLSDVNSTIKIEKILTSIPTSH